jgi:hypothetical protein
MKLLNEFTEAVSTEVLTEGTDGKKAYNITGPFIHTEEANRNGRIYIKEHMAPEVARYKRDFIDTRRALGELSHPEGPTINPDKVSHLITKLEFDGNLCIGEAKILDTPNGNIVKSFIDAGVNFGVSTRGLGSIKESNGIKYVQPDFRLVTVDIVLDPSGKACYVDGLMEGKEWLFIEGKGWVEQYLEESRKTLKSIKASEVEPMALRIFENFLAKL